MLRSKLAEIAKIRKNPETQNGLNFSKFSYDKLMLKILLVAFERCIFAADRVERERMFAKRVFNAY